MGKRNVRVDIPFREPEKMITLGSDIRTRHAVLGGASPLNNEIDMTAFAAVHQLAKDKRKEALDDHGFGEAKIQLADRAMGTDVGQTIGTPGTIYYYTARFRDRLLLTYQGTEEELSTFGFNVVVSSFGKKKTVRVDLPIKSPLEMERLVAKIIERHTALGAGSPLNNTDVTAITSQLQITIDKRKEGNDYHQQAEAAMQQSDKALGTGKGQTIETEGTVYYMMNRIRKILLLAYQGVEEEISTFGFNVVISEAGTGGVPTPPPAPVPAVISITTDQNLPSMLNVNITGNSFSTGAELIITWLLGIFNSSVPINGALINFQYLYTAGIYTFTITGLLTAIGTLQIAGANLTSILIPAGLHIANLDLSNNKLDLDRVNGIIIALDANGILNGTLHLEGGTNAAPAGAGLTAKNNLIAKGWMVTTN